MATKQGNHTTCEFFATCEFCVTIMASVPQFSSKIQNKYCLAGFPGCARYVYAKQHGFASIPEDLFPSAFCL